MEPYIASLDIGTTTIRCQILNQLGKRKGISISNVELLYPHPGYVEIDPNDLFEKIVNVVKGAILDAHIEPQDVKCIGICTQRSSFINWRKDNGQPLHNIITWNDSRAAALSRQINKSFSISIVRYISYVIYLFTRNKRYLSGSRLKLSPNHASSRLLWAISNIKPLQEAIKDNNAMFGTVETWLIYKLTGGGTYVTDMSNATATGFYDPFVKEWGSWAIHILKIPANILPPVVANDYKFGSTKEDIFGVSIPITCSMGDQNSSMFALGCYNKGDLKVTLGTGGFLNVNTHDDIETAMNGMYPLVGWMLDGKIVHMSEVPCSDVGSSIEWALNSGFLEKATDLHDIAMEIKDSDGVFFIPAFSGLGPPINNNEAACGFIGIKPTTRKEHMIRALLESIVFRVTLTIDMMQKEIPYNYTKLRIDGGVSQNDFICQMLADVSRLKVERLTSTEMSSLGVGFVAGLKIGIWKDLSQLDKLRQVDRVFEPTSDPVYEEKLQNKLNQWLKAAHKFKSWYKEDAIR